VMVTLLEYGQAILSEPNEADEGEAASK
jgi:hypothetical protein